VAERRDRNIPVARRSAVISGRENGPFCSRMRSLEPAARTAPGWAAFWRSREVLRFHDIIASGGGIEWAQSSGRIRRQPHLQKPQHASSTAQHSRACLQIPTSNGSTAARITLYAGTC